MLVNGTPAVPCCDWHHCIHVSAKSQYSTFCTHKGRNHTLHTLKDFKWGAVRTRWIHIQSNMLFPRKRVLMSRERDSKLCVYPKEYPDRWRSTLSVYPNTLWILFFLWFIYLLFLCSFFSFNPSSFPAYLTFLFCIPPILAYFIFSIYPSVHLSTHSPTHT